MTEQRQASTLCKSRLAERLEEPRHDMNANVPVSKRPNCAQEILVPVVREGEDDVVDVVLVYDVQEVMPRAEERNVRKLEPKFLRLGVHEPDQIRSVLGMLQELAREQLSDVARPDDDCPLDIRTPKLEDRTCGGPPREHEKDGQRQKIAASLPATG
jgi:hypothetical protein